MRGEAAVDDAAGVRVAQRVAQLPRNLHLVVHRHLPEGELGTVGVSSFHGWESNIFVQLVNPHSM